MKHPPEKRGLLPVTECIFVLTLYFGACAWGKCLFHGYNTWSPCCALQRTAARKNKQVKAQNPSLAFTIQFEIQPERKTVVCGHVCQQQDLGANLSSIKRHRSNSLTEKIYVGNRYILNARKFLSTPLMLCAHVKISLPPQHGLWATCSSPQSRGKCCGRSC